MAYYLRIDQFHDKTELERVGYVGVYSNVGGLGSFLWAPMVIFVNYFTQINYTGQIIKRLFTKRQKHSEFMAKHSSKTKVSKV